jgi:hypothetical protein
MADRTTFTQEEWEILYLTPLYVSGMVMMAGTSGITGTLLEIYAAGTARRDAAKAYPDNRLIQEMNREENIPNLKDLNESDKPHDGVAMNAKALEGIRKSREILAAKASPEEAEQYRKWVYAIADSVANAAKEGTLLGFGGQRVSGGEVEALKTLKSELGL